jgi:methylamine dehydrogenase accessory protein MauD
MGSAMIEALVISQAILLLLVVILGVLLFATIRQLGVIYERVAPLGALTLPSSLSPGEPVPQLRAHTTKGDAIEIGGTTQGNRAQLLLFISPDCPMCKQLLSMLRWFAKAESGRVDVVLVGDGSEAAYLDLVHTYALVSMPLVIDRRIGVTYQVGQLPFAMLIDASGVLRAAGLVNSREHLESLVTAFENGVTSLQDYLLTQHAGADSSGTARAASNHP